MELSKQASAEGAQSQGHALLQRYPLTSRWMLHEGSRMHYVDEGRGRPVLLLHGNPTWSYAYRHVIGELRGEARLIAPDYPGFGLSDHPPGYGYTPVEHARWVELLIERLDLHGIVLVVQDWGGPIGLSIAVRRPERIAGVVVLNTWCWRPDVPMRLFSMAMGSRGLGRYLTIKRNLFVRKLIPAGIVHKEKLTPEVMDAYQAPFRMEAARTGVWVFPRAITKSADWVHDTEARLGVLREKPAAILWPARDPAFGKARYLARWRAVFPKAKVETVADAGHYIQEDRPDRVSAAIRTVLARTP